MIEVLLFDLDETLVDSRGAILDFHRRLFDAVGLPFPESEEEQRVFYTESRLGIAERFFPTDELRARVAAFIADNDFSQWVQGITLKPGARAALEWCAERFILALATNRGASTEAVLEATDIGGLFQLVYHFETMPKPKPDPWVVREVIERVAVDPQAVVFVGDSSHDLTCAALGGIRSIAVGDNWRGGPHTPTWTIGNMTELIPLLQSILPPPAPLDTRPLGPDGAPLPDDPFSRRKGAESPSKDSENSIH